MNRYILGNLGRFWCVPFDIDLSEELDEMDNNCGSCRMTMFRGIYMTGKDFIDHIHFLHQEVMKKDGSEERLKAIRKKSADFNEWYHLFDTEHEDYYDGCLEDSDFFYESFEEGREMCIIPLYFDLIREYYRVDFQRFTMQAENHIFDNRSSRERNLINGPRPKIVVFIGCFMNFDDIEELAADEMVGFFQKDLNLLTNVYNQPVKQWMLNLQCYCCS